MELQEATVQDLDQVCRLYRSASASPYSVWNDQYPVREDACLDLQARSLFVLRDGNALIGCLSIVPKPELGDIADWRFFNSAEISRIAIAPEFQGRCLSKLLVRSIFPVLKLRGYSSVRLSAAICNLPAWKTYLSLGFEIRGEADLYGNSYYLMERSL